MRTQHRIDQRKVYNAVADEPAGAVAQIVIKKGIISAFWSIVILLVFGSLLVSAIEVVINATGLNPRDDTDPPGGRSGMSVKIDCGAGLQYLSTPEGGLTPRLTLDGAHMRATC